MRTWSAYRIAETAGEHPSAEYHHRIDRPDGRFKVLALLSAAGSLLDLSWSLWLVFYGEVRAEMGRNQSST